jgi:protein XagA
MFRCLVITSAVLTALVGAGTSSSYAGAWLRAEGQSEIIFATSWTDAKRRFDGEGKSIAIGRFSKFSAQTTVEYGLTSDVTLIAGLAGQRQSSPSHLQGSMNSAGLAGARIQLWSAQQTILSLQATSEITGEQRNKLLQNYRSEPPASADLRLLLGHSFTFNGLPSFIDLQAGYRWRGGSHADEIRFDLTFGVRPASKFLFLLQSFNIVATERDQRFTVKPARQHKLQTSLVYDMTQNLSLQVGGFLSIAGRENLRERGGLLALWWKI